MKLAIPFAKREDSRARVESEAGSQTGPARARKARRKRSRIARVSLLLVIAAATAGGLYLWQSNTSAKGAPQTINVPVTTGDLSTTVESSGKAEATSSTSVDYETEGHVVEVMVNGGDKVKAGQPLVRLSDQSQKLALQEAMAALDTAKAKVEDLKSGSSAAEINSAQADLQAAQADMRKVQAGATSREIADAQAELRAAQANLDKVRAGATPQDVADAQAELRAAQANLDKVRAGATARDLTDAQADLDAAKANLAELRKPASSGEVTAAESELRAARARLAALKAGPTAAALSTAQLNVANAQAALKSVQTKAALDKQMKQLALDKADRDLEQAQRDWVKALNKTDSKGNSIVDDKHNFIVDPSDRFYDTLYQQYWAAYNAMKNAEAAQTQAYNELQNVLKQEVDEVTAAQAKIDDANKQLQNVRSGATPSELADAQASVDKAQKSFDDLQAGPTSDKVAAAQAGVAKAQAKLSELKAGPGADEIAAAEAKVVQAQSKLDQLKAGPATDKLADAQSQLDKARNKLNDLRSQPSQADISQAQAKIAQKEAALQKILKPVSASELATAQEGVVKAHKSLNDAQTNLDKTVLRAPFSGVVGEVNAEPNAIISVGTAALTLYSPDGMHLALDVSEGDIEKIKVGMAASITVDAIPGKTITGTVTSISPVATTGKDVVSYKVRVSFNPASLPVKVGMSANASITVETRKGVVQVPNKAITTQGPFKTVQVMYTKDGKKTPVAVRVTTGITNGQMTEITGCVDTKNQCLKIGDQVAITIQTASNGQGGGPGGPGGPIQFASGGPVGGKGDTGVVNIQVGP